MIGAGKYDDACTAVREMTKAKGVVVIVLDGNHGNGFSCQTDLQTLTGLPDLLENMARQIRDDLKKTPG